jgi:hypothetical protein
MCSALSHPLNTLTHILKTSRVGTNADRQFKLIGSGSLSLLPHLRRVKGSFCRLDNSFEQKSSSFFPFGSAVAPPEASIFIIIEPV